jgi:hypothetical protein
MIPSLVTLTALALPAAPAPKPPPAYFVTQRGARLVYQDGNYEVVVVVAAVEQKGRATVVTLDRLAPPPTRQEEKVAVSPEGLVRIEGYGIKFTDPLCLLKLPAKRGDRWKVDGKTVARCAGEEEVTVGAGTFKALRVDSVTDPGNEGKVQHVSSWFAPGPGEVKFVVDGEVRRTLKSFTPAESGPAKP